MRTACGIQSEVYLRLVLVNRRPKENLPLDGEGSTVYLADKPYYGAGNHPETRGEYGD